MNIYLFAILALVAAQPVVDTKRQLQPRAPPTSGNGSPSRSAGQPAQGSPSRSQGQPPQRAQGSPSRSRSQPSQPAHGSPQRGQGQAGPSGQGPSGQGDAPHVSRLLSELPRLSSQRMTPEDFDKHSRIVSALKNAGDLSNPSPQAMEYIQSARAAQNDAKEARQQAAAEKTRLKTTPYLSQAELTTGKYQNAWAKTFLQSVHHVGAMKESVNSGAFTTAADQLERYHRAQLKSNAIHTKGLAVGAKFHHLNMKWRRISTSEDRGQLKKALKRHRDAVDDLEVGRRTFSGNSSGVSVASGVSDVSSMSSESDASS